MLKKALLLINLGTPDDPSRYSVYRYLKEFLLDPRVIDIPWIARQLLVRARIAPFRSKPTSDAYKELWFDNGSPLRIYGDELVEKVQKRLGDEYKVALGMRYQNPSLESAIDKLLEEPVEELIVLPLFPQYASASTGSAHQEVMRVLSKRLGIPKLRLIDAFPDFPPMIKAFADRGREHGLENYDHVLFSFHGLPERQLEKLDHCGHCLKDGCCNTLSERNYLCYKAHCYATSRALSKELGLTENEFSVCFQSRLGRAEWIKPYTTDVLKKLAGEGKKKLLVFCPAFVADCLETIVEVGDEYNEEFKEMGGEKVQLVKSLNSDDDWADAVCDLIS